MSVAERVPQADTASHGEPSSTIDNILRLAFNGVAAARPVPAPVRRAEPDYGMAADLLDRATAAIAGLTLRRDELEQTVVRQEERAARDESVYAERINLLQAEAAEWERRAKVMKAQLQDSESRLAEQQMRIEALNDRAENAEARVAVAEQMADEARRQSQMYHDKILETFGSLT